jgi:hypothetical protein
MIEITRRDQVLQAVEFTRETTVDIMMWIGVETASPPKDMNGQHEYLLGTNLVHYGDWLVRDFNSDWHVIQSGDIGSYRLVVAVDDGRIPRTVIP